LRPRLHKLNIFDFSFGSTIEIRMEKVEQTKLIAAGGASLAPDGAAAHSVTGQGAIVSGLGLRRATAAVLREVRATIKVVGCHGSRPVLLARAVAGDEFRHKQASDSLFGDAPLDRGSIS
jgi:hypothetical protein